MTLRPVLRFALVPLVALLLLAGGGLGFQAYLRATDNLHPIVAGQAYRSGQLDAPGLDRTIRTLGLRSVINLRGAEPDQPWYQAERAVTDRLGVRLIDFRMSDAQELDPQQMQTLIALMRAAPKPLLIHCRAGADRTGLAAALYKLAISGAPPGIASEQLSIRYGHVGLPVLSRAWPMDDSLEDYLDLGPAAIRPQQAGPLSLPARPAVAVTRPKGG